MAEPRKSTRRTRSAAEDFFQELDAPQKHFLTQDEKDDAATRAVPFYVTAVELTESKQYGDRWELEIESDSRFSTAQEGQRIIMTLPAHGARNYIMRKLQAATQNGKVGPLMLTITELEEGMTWLALKRVLPNVEK